MNAKWQATGVVLLLAAVAWGATVKESLADEFSLAERAKPYTGSKIRIIDEVSDLQSTFYKELVPVFEKETGIEVDVEIQGHFDVITNGQSDLFSGRGAFDAVMLHHWQLANSIEAQAIEPLNPFLENPALRDPSVSPETFFQPIADEATVVDGQRFGLLTWNYNEVWIGRKDLMTHPDEQAAFEEQYGYPLAPPRTLEEMRDIAEFFTRDTGEKLAGDPLSSPMYGFVQEGARLGGTWGDVWFNYIRQFGGDLFDESGSPTATRPENAAGLEFWKSMFKFAPPGASETSLVDIPVVLGEGQAATGIAFSDFFWTVDSEGGSPLAGKFSYAPVPPPADHPDEHEVTMAPSFLVINAASDNKEATYLFLQWVVSQATQDAWLKVVVEQGKGGLDPVLTSTLKNPLYSRGKRAELLDAIAGSIAVGHSAPHLRNFPRFQDAMLQRFQEFLLGDRDAKGTLEVLQGDFEKICSSNCLIRVSQK